MHADFHPAAITGRDRPVSAEPSICVRHVMTITKKRFSAPKCAKRTRPPGLARNKRLPNAISLDEDTLSKRRTKMSRKAAMTLAVLFAFSSASAVLAETNNRTDPGSLSQRPVSIMSNGPTGVFNETGKAFTSEQNGWFAPSRPDLAQGTPFRRGATGETIVWIKLTEPGGKLIHISLEHVTSVRSATVIPGAKAQLDLTSGKFQGVQEDVEQIMQLISGAPSTRENDEAPSTAPLVSR
jgi:hypothetical protein